MLSSKQRGVLKILRDNPDSYITAVKQTDPKAARKYCILDKNGFALISPFRRSIVNNLFASGKLTRAEVDGKIYYWLKDYKDLMFTNGVLTAYDQDVIEFLDSKSLNGSSECEIALRRKLRLSRQQLQG